MGSVSMMAHTFLFGIFMLLGISLAGKIESNVGKSNCDEGWIDATDIHFGRLYIYTGAELTWAEANKFCFTNFNTHQIIIENEVQFDFLEQQLDVISQIGGFKYAWTAGTDVGTEGHWYYPAVGNYMKVPDFLWNEASFNDGIEHNFMKLLHSMGWKADDRTASTTADITICQTFV